MNVLIVEDDENKGEQLTTFLRNHFAVGELHIARSLQSGLKRIKAQRPDIILLDMTLPNYDTSPEEPGGTTHLLGCRECVRQMERFDLAIPTIVVTQFETFGNPPDMGLDQLDAELKVNYHKIYYGAVYYHASINDWKIHLTRLINLALGQQ